MEHLATRFPGVRHHDREEIVQDVLVKADKNLDEFRSGGPEQLFKWAKAMAHNAAVDWLRAQPTEKILSLDAAYATPVPPPPPSKRRLKKRLLPVRLFLKQLPERERDAITLVDINDVPIRRAAEILGITYNALIQARHRAHDKLHVLVRAHPEILRPWARK